MRDLPKVTQLISSGSEIQTGCGRGRAMRMGKEVPGCHGKEGKAYLWL